MMKGINGLMDALLNPSVNGVRKDSQGSTDGISFGQFMQQWKGNRVGSTSQKPVMGKEEQQLLERSLEHLLNFKLQLQKPQQAEALTMEGLKKLLAKMGQDTDFLNSLTPELKAQLQKLLQMMKEGKDLKVEAKGIEELNRIWQMQQEKKREKMLAEVDELLASIQERLALAGITAKVQVVEKNGEKSAQINFFKNPGQDGSQKNAENQEGSNVLSRSLLSRISGFLSGAEGSEKADLNKRTFELREDLRHFLKKESQPVGWRKEEIIHKAQYGNLQELHEPQAEVVDPTLMEEAIKAVAQAEMVKDSQSVEAARLQATPEVEEIFHLTEAQETDTLSRLLANVETNIRDVRNMLEHVTREERPYQPQAQDLFQQIVERFRLDIKQGVSQMEVKLHPEELGNMYLKITVEKGLVTAQFLTENIRVKELIEQNIAQLRETFAKDGIRWDQITVDVGHEGLRENPFAYQGQQEMKDQRNSGKRQKFSDSMAEELELAIGEESEESKPVKDPNRIIDYRA